MRQFINKWFSKQANTAKTKNLNAERQRLEAQHEGREDWRHWGPYLAERAWGTVREDYSANGISTHFIFSNRIMSK